MSTKFALLLLFFTYTLYGSGVWAYEDLRMSEFCFGRNWKSPVYMCSCECYLQPEVGNGVSECVENCGAQRSVNVPTIYGSDQEISGSRRGAYDGRAAFAGRNSYSGRDLFSGDFGNEMDLEVPDMLSENEPETEFFDERIQATGCRDGSVDCNNLGVCYQKKHCTCYPGAEGPKCSPTKFIETQMEKGTCYPFQLNRYCPKTQLHDCVIHCIRDPLCYGLQKGENGNPFYQVILRGAQVTSSCDSCQFPCIFLKKNICNQMVIPPPTITPPPLTTTTRGPSPPPTTGLPTTDLPTTDLPTTGLPTTGLPGTTRITRAPVTPFPTSATTAAEGATTGAAETTPDITTAGA